MLDIIIPLYNSHTIWDTLASIAYQTDTDVSVTIVDDCSSSKYDYSKMIKFFQKYLDIHYYRLEKNSGPGVARQVGIERSHAPYIMFMDSDDSLGGVEVIRKIKEYLQEDYEMMIGVFVEESFQDVFFHDHDQTWLHGKIYQRKFLEENHIHFNDTYKNEDNFFNQLCFLHLPKLKYLEDTLYIYRNNMNSLTRSDNYAYNYEGTIYYAFNISEAMRESLEDGCSERDVSILGFRCLIPCYYYYIEWSPKKDVSKLLEYSRRIYQMIDFSYITDEIRDDAFRSFLYYLIADQYQLVLQGLSFDEFIQKMEVQHD